jgi:hypothetical protein
MKSITIYYSTKSGETIDEIIKRECEARGIDRSKPINIILWPKGCEKQLDFNFSDRPPAPQQAPWWHK